MNPTKILLDHGSGGRASHQLINELILTTFNNPILATLDDGAVFQLNEQRFAFSTDSYTVVPLFFPGGNIGELAINGTVNDLAMCGAKPLYLSVGFIIEEGFPIDDFQKILSSMQKAAAQAGIMIITGDTKVVPRGTADKIFINTTGIGIIPNHITISGTNARPGDKIIISGTIADHGITILTRREGLQFESPLQSDTAPLNSLVALMLATTPQIHTLRDPTRGGVATTLNEIAGQSKMGMKLYENALPIRDEVRGACELLGLDPLYLANEGKLIACVAPEAAEALLKAMQQHPYAHETCIIGEVTADHRGTVIMETGIGGTRIVDMLSGEPLPRIC